MKSDRTKIALVMGRGAVGGIERHVQSLVRHLDRGLFDPHVFILFGEGPVSRELGDAGVPVTVLNGLAGWDPVLALRLRGALRGWGADLTHSHEMHGALGLCMRSLPGLPWLHTEHCSFDHGPSPARARVLWRLFQVRVNRVLAVSSATGEALVRHTGFPCQRLETVFNGLDVGSLPSVDDDHLRRELGIADDCALVGFVGRLVPQKGWRDFVSTCLRLSLIEPRARFVIAGDGPDRGALERLIGEQSQGEREKFHLLGMRPDAAAVIGGLDLFMMTSIHEELPTTLLEAFAMGTPVTGFLPEGGVAEMMSLSAEPIAELLAGRDPDALALAASRLLRDQGSRERFAARGAELVGSHFRMDGIARRIGEIYGSLVRPAGRAEDARRTGE